MSTSTQLIHLRILAASTGITYPISLHPNELTVTNIRRHLAGAVPPEDQILLLGPPYKVPKDATLRSEEVLSSLRLGDLEDDINQLSNECMSGESLTSELKTETKSLLSTTEKTGARRLFLFSKQALSDSAPDLPPCILQPMDLVLPTEPDPSPLVYDQTSPGTPASPLHQALDVYERQFMLHLCRGRALADGADMRFKACRNCVAEQAVMARALRAAVSNLSDHRNGAARTRTEFSSVFHAQTSDHASLLQRLDNHLSALAKIPLHPALVSIARSSGRMMETLLDTVPVERERVWAAQCQTSHTRLLEEFQNLDATFQQIGTKESREEEYRSDLQAEDEIKTLWSEVEGIASEIRNRQAERLHCLTSNHGEVVRAILNAMKDGNAQSAFSVLENLSKSSKDIVPSMESDDSILKELMIRISNAKTRAMKRMKTRLRQVSITQSAIQKVLQNVNVLRDALAQQSTNMTHLEHIVEFPAAYNDFLNEIRRRKAYGKATSSLSSVMVDKLTNMRMIEVKAREKFLQTSGRHLMPAFFEIFMPTLATLPVVFSPQLPSMVEMETIPDIGNMNIEPRESTITNSSSMGSDYNDNLMQENISRDASSTITDDPSHSHVERKVEALQHHGETESLRIESSASNEKTSQQALIVSAEENNTNVNMMDIPCNDNDEVERSEVDAERKALSYENSILRQTIERLGGKPPQIYVKEATEKNKEPGNISKNQSCLTAEIEKLREELNETNSKLKHANEALDDLKKEKDEDRGCDKISHSSFEVGDIGLFMPTGRGSGGKGIYLAFHTNCPHRYLSIDSIKGSPDYVLGRIIYQEENTAGPVGSDSNPFGLHAGTTFWILTVEVLKIP